MYIIKKETLPDGTSVNLIIIVDYYINKLYRCDDLSNVYKVVDYHRQLYKK